MKKAPPGDTEEPRYADATWVQTINRLLGAEMRLDPRPKPGKTARLKYWNQTDLAKAAGLRTNTVSDALLGKRLPGIDTLEAIGRVFNIPAFMFLMPVDEAERYAQFRASVQVDDAAARNRKVTLDVVAELLPEIANMVDRRQSGQPAEPAIVPTTRKKHA